MLGSVCPGTAEGMQGHSRAALFPEEPGGATGVSGVGARRTWPLSTELGHLWATSGRTSPLSRRLGPGIPRATLPPAGVRQRPEP